MNITKENAPAMRELAHAILAECNTVEAPAVVAASDWPMTAKGLPNEGLLYISNRGLIINLSAESKVDGNEFAAEADAKSALAFSQLSRLVRHINGGWWPDFTDSEDKYSVSINSDKLTKDCWQSCCLLPACLYFKNREDRDRSMTDHRELWEQYFQKDVTE